MPVYVQDINGHPLMPTERCGWVRKALKAGKAIVVTRRPFTIRLTYETKTNAVQPITLGVDAGSEH
ncbi:MAG: RRXRR domain-containing protein, partial [Clostridiales bacterium]|nr:RRXRR domain-containing protein [Clostridiales bacterium]